MLQKLLRREGFFYKQRDVTLPLINSRSSICLSEKIPMHALYMPQCESSKSKDF